MLNVLVTGGTGVLGRPVVQSLAAQGHNVRVLAHSLEAERGIRKLGGEPVHFDLLDPASTTEGVGGAEVVLHLATRIPPSGKMGKREAWVENDRLRIEGTRNLVDAALAGQVQTFIYPSVVLVYPDSGNAWIDSRTAQPEPIAFVCSTMESEAQVRRFAEAGRRGITLRMGGFYGPESGHIRDILAYARRGLAAVMGPGDAYQSSVWIEDAARAVTAALERAPAGIYDVVDDEPLQRAELVTSIARAVGKKHLWRMPDLLMRLFVGADAVAVNSRSQRVSNRRFREASGWAPQVPSAREGWARLALKDPSLIGEPGLLAG